MVVSPYVEGIAEKFQRICWKYRVSTAMRPTNTLKSLLVHPKDKKNNLETSEVVYEFLVRVAINRMLVNPVGSWE